MTSTPPARRTRALLALVVLFLGGSGLVYEYALSTLATHLLGNSIEQFSVIIALMLFAMGIAGLVQRDLSRALAEAFIFIELLLALIGGASALLLYLAFAYLTHFNLILYGLALLIGFLIGLEIPLLLRLNEAWRSELKENVGDVFALDYIGALIGALIWAFLLLPLFALDQISLMLGLLNTLVALMTLYALRDRLQRPRLLLALTLMVAAILGGLALWAPKLLTDARQRLYAHPIKHHVKSPYQDMVVTGRGGQMSLYLNGHLQFDSEDEFIYHELLVHPALASLDAPPREVLVLGGGDGLAVREILRWPSVTRVVLVDLDPAVTTLARTYPPLVKLNGGALLDPRAVIQAPTGISDGPGRAPVYKWAERPQGALRHQREEIADVQLLHLDADAFIRGVTQQYDAIIADFPDPAAPDLAKLFSLEFYQQLSQRLRPGGIVAVQASSPYTNRHAYWAIGDTLMAAGFQILSLHDHVPNFGEWGWHLGRLDARPQPIAPLPFRPAYVTPEVMAAAAVFPPPLARPQGGPWISTRLHPRVMNFYLRGEPIEGDLFAGRAMR
ncbi:polyamine aminopropyltransferase [Myxococcota bacterium]|nr:polyamine aminopropyltransferase [Myxococcota bacterium]